MNRCLHTNLGHYWDAEQAESLRRMLYINDFSNNILKETSTTGKKTTPNTRDQLHHRNWLQFEVDNRTVDLLVRLIEYVARADCDLTYVGDTAHSG